jgi:hypothetical protein
MSPLLARTGPTEPVGRCPLIGASRKWRFGVEKTVFDPEWVSDFGQGEIGFAQILAGRRFAKC